MRFGTIVVIGGGCYGSYYVRQLDRAAAAGKAEWQRLMVVDRDPGCAVARAGPASVELVVDEWPRFLTTWLGTARAAADAIVPSPLMPHLLFDWILARACARWPGRDIVPELPGAFADIPWQKEGGDRTRYVSYATWICPINCIEPTTCPHTRGARDWSLHDRLRDLDGRDAVPTAVLPVTHRVFGVGMVDVADVLAADRLVSTRLSGTGLVRIATASHCHGAVGGIRMVAPVPPPSAQGDI